MTAWYCHKCAMTIPTDEIYLLTWDSPHGDECPLYQHDSTESVERLKAWASSVLDRPVCRGTGREP